MHRRIPGHLRPTRLWRALTLVAATATLAAPAPGADRTWIGGGSSLNSWSLILNWDSVPVGSFTDNLFLGNRGNWSTSTNNLGPLQLNTLNLSGRNWTIRQSVAPLTHTPSALLFAAGGGIRASGRGLVHEVQGSIVANASAPGAIFVPEPFNTDVADAELRLTGPISGLGSLVKLGNGTLTLTGDNTHFGGTVVRSGVVRAGSTTALGHGPLTLLGGSFDTAGQTVRVSALRFNDQTQLGIRGGVRATGGGKLLLEGPIVYDDTPFTRENLPLLIDPDVSFGNHTRRISSNSHFGAYSFDVVFRGTVEGSGGMLVDGLMTSVALARASTLQGEVRVRGGQLSLLAPDALAAASAVTLEQGSLFLSSIDSVGGAIGTGSFNQAIRVLQGSGLVALGGAELMVGGFEGTATFSGRIVGSGSVLKAGIGTWVLSGDNSYTGGSTVLAGVLQGTTQSLRGNIRVVGTLGLVQDTDGVFSGSLRDGGLLLKDGSGTVDARAPGTLTAFTGRIDVRGGLLRSSFEQVHRPLVLSGAGALEVQVDSAGRWSAPLAGDGRLLKTGPGTLQMAGQTWQGSFVAGAGGVEFNGVHYRGAALGTEAGGQMVLGGTNTVLRADSFSNRGVLTGSGRIEAPVVSSGSVQVGAQGHLVIAHAGGLVNTGTVQLQQGALDVTGTLDNRAGGRIVGSGTLTAGTLRNQGEVAVGAGSSLTIVGTLSGGGRFSGPGTVNLQGLLQPGDNSAGRVVFEGDLLLGSGAMMQLELGGVHATFQHDQVAVIGTGFADGTLQVLLTGGYMPRDGDQFRLLLGRWTGSFDSLLLPALGPGRDWDSSALMSTGLLTAVPEPPAAALLALGVLALLWRRKALRR